MSEEQTDEQPQRARRGFIAQALYGTPKNLIFTVCTVIVIGTMITNSAARKKELNEQKTHKTEYPVQFDETGKIAPLPPKTSVLTSEGETPELLPTPKPAAPPEKAEEVKPTIPETTQKEITENHNALTALEEKIAVQEKTITALSEQVQSIAALREEISAIETRSSQKLASFTLFSQLRETANQGKNFKSTLDQLLELNKTNPRTNALLIQLLPVATTGLHSMEELQKQFTAALDAFLQRDTGNTFTHNLRKLIRIRKIGEQTGTDDESILARAEKSLTAQDLQATLKTLDTLTPEGKKSMAAWVRSAQEYINAQSTITALQLSLATDTPVEAPKSVTVEIPPAPQTSPAPPGKTEEEPPQPLVDPAPPAATPDAEEPAQDDKVAQ